MAIDKNKHGLLHMRIVELLAERNISKNRICKDLVIPRSNFNRYCRDEFQSIDANMVCKICDYLDIVGSRFEFDMGDKTKDFELFTDRSIYR